MSIILSIIYLIATVTFIVGLKKLGHPDSAKSGNLTAAGGMGLAIVGTIFIHDLQVPTIIYVLIGIAILLGAIIGWFIAIKVEMTKMPELVSLFNGFGGASAALIGIVEFGNSDIKTTSATIVATILSAIVIGAITFSGSLMAWGKLNGSVKSIIKIPQYNIINNLVIIAIVVLAAFVVVENIDSQILLYSLLFAGLVYGVLFVMPIGGADMPVVISLLNSLTGIAAAITGILYDNMVMLVGGILVGSAGIILTVAMCKAMNRTLLSVIFGSFTASAGPEGTNKALGSIKSTTASDTATRTTSDGTCTTNTKQSIPPP